MMMRLAVVACIAACGRVGFDPVGVDANPIGIDAQGDAQAPAIAWVQAFAQYYSNVSGTTDMLMASPHAAGDAFVLHVRCTRFAALTGVSVTAPGWTFAPIGPLTGTAGVGQWVASFGAIAPDTTLAPVTVTFAGACSDRTYLGDELTNNDPTGGAVTFEAHDEQVAPNLCSGTVTIPHRGDMLWAACGGGTAAVAPGFTKGADDNGADLSEYRITNDPPGTSETATFSFTGFNGAMTVVAIKPR